MKEVLTQLRLHYKGSVIPIIMSLAGMAIAFVAAIVILVQVYYDVTYDTFHENADRLYKVQTSYVTEKTDSMGMTETLCVPFVKALLHENDGLPRIKNISYSVFYPNHRSWNGGETDFALPFFVVDSTFVKMFSFKVVAGSLDCMGEGHESALIPESVALKYWGRTDIVGEILSDRTKVTVGCVYKDFPTNSILKNYIYLPIAGIEKDSLNWSDWKYSIFIELDETKQHERLEIMLNERLEQMKTQLSSVSPLSMEKWRISLIPVHELHYIQCFSDNNKTIITKDEVILLLFVSIIVLLIAGFNFANFQIAIVPKRMKNINIRRILGARRNRLLLSIIGESVLWVCLSWAIAVVFILSFADEWMFSTSSERMGMAEILPVCGFTFVFAVMIGIAIGAYPAYYLTHEPLQIALKRHFGLSRYSRLMQDVMLTVQMFCSITLIMCSVAIFAQERYLLSGGNIDKEHLLFAFMKDTIPDSKPLYEKINSIDGVEGVALSMKIPTTQDIYTAYGWKNVIATIFSVSKDYHDVMGINIVEGRAFNESDKYAFIFNVTAKEKYPDRIGVGKRFGYSEDFEGVEIVGICEDINYKSLRNPIDPMGYVLESDDRLTCVNVKIGDSSDMNMMKKRLNEALDEVDVNYEHNFRSLDDIYVTTYRYEMLTSRRILLFALVAIVINIMGLCGMVIMNSEYYARDVAVKQVFGASISQLVRGLLLRYLVMSMIAVCMCIPVYHYFIVGSWLNQYFYRVDLTWEFYCLTLLLTVLLIWAIAAVFILRYMRKNPVEILKYE